MASWLRRQGFTVTGVYWADTHRAKQNHILAFTGDTVLANRLAAALGPAGSTVVTESPYHDYPGLDMKITVGSDSKLNRLARV